MVETLRELRVASDTIVDGVPDHARLQGRSGRWSLNVRGAQLLHAAVASAPDAMRVPSGAGSTTRYDEPDGYRALGRGDVSDGSSRPTFPIPRRS